jgi:hypothetical protein
METLSKLSFVLVLVLMMLLKYGACASLWMCLSGVYTAEACAASGAVYSVQRHVRHVDVSTRVQ